MPPYAICITNDCDYLFDLNEGARGQLTQLPPHFCPSCKGRVIFYCPLCRWPILAIPDAKIPRCGNCTARLRQIATSVAECALLPEDCRTG